MWGEHLIGSFAIICTPRVLPRPQRHDLRVAEQRRLDLIEAPSPVRPLVSNRMRASSCVSSLTDGPLHGNPPHDGSLPNDFETLNDLEHDGLPLIDGPSLPSLLSYLGYGH